MDAQTEAALKRAIGMLEAILSRQIELHRRMAEVAEEKRESIIKGDIEKLEAAVSEERQLIAKIEEEENNRQGVMPLLIGHLGLPRETQKLADVIAHFPEADRERMMAIRNELREILEAVRLKTRHNAELLKTSMDHVESFLKSLSEATAPDSNYRKNGKRGGGGPAIIDRNA